MFQRGGETNPPVQEWRDGLWAAYGYSAYKVAEMQKCQNHVPVVENYSRKMLMPVVVFGNDTFRYVTGLCRCEEENPDYTRLTIPEPARTGTGGYQQWAQGLRDSKEGNKG